MTLPDRGTVLARRRMRETRRDMVLTVLAGVGLAGWVSGPTWRSLGLAVVLVAGAAVVAGLCGAAVMKVLRRPVAPVVIGVIVATLNEVLRWGLVAWGGLGAAEAAWMGVWSFLVGLGVMLASLRLALRTLAANQAGEVEEPGERPGSLLSPLRLIHSVALICQEVARCLLVAWSPWLVLVTIAEAGLAGGFPRNHPASTWIATAGGYTLLAVALALWLR
ncbi:hypothetical protein FXF51_14395 [Nonomuraea sp. PA05]|uniref:hypothetical protein n=1 Tax=Nonomuraea sp. PA05 TaxID=2604466 RepID=UPI0011D41D98|nr:hypothetical protein [Nonomuraea sp. PA05]TYB67084.1 hypothetical protein FXF51_14395 [Nonomuraea sp. PA05]